jgi:hypothetical protein
VVQRASPEQLRPPPGRDGEPTILEAFDLAVDLVLHEVRSSDVGELLASALTGRLDAQVTSTDDPLEDRLVEEHRVDRSSGISMPALEITPFRDTSRSFVTTKLVVVHCRYVNPKKPSAPRKRSTIAQSSGAHQLVRRAASATSVTTASNAPDGARYHQCGRRSRTRSSSSVNRWVGNGMSRH